MSSPQGDAPEVLTGRDDQALDDPRVLRAVQEYQAVLETGRRPNRQEFLARHAEIAGPLEVGQVKPWRTVLSVPLEAEESGRVTVSRIISAGDLDCKEIIIAVDRSNRETLPASQFYVASICRNGSRWSWASAEPATERWSSLQ